MNTASITLQAQTKHCNLSDLDNFSLDWHPSDHISFVDTVHLRKLHTDSPVTITKNNNDKQIMSITITNNNYKPSKKEP